MRKANRGRNIILITLTTILCGTTVLTAYANNVKGETSANESQNAEIAIEEEKPVLSQAEEKTLFGRQYVLENTTTGGAGIYVNEEDNRARDYVIKALEEAGIDSRMTDMDKIKAINNYLCDRLAYADYAATKDYIKEDWIPFTDYCLISGQSGAVCAGYAEAFQSMCVAAGIECYYVTGYVYQNSSPEGIYHAWNRVDLNERSYYIDVCWNDSSNDAYFLSANGWADHEIDEEQEIYRISSQMLPMPEYINQ